MLLLTPIVVLRLDATEVAVWFVFLTLISMQNIVDFGFAPTFSRVIAYSMAGVRSFQEIGQELKGNRLSGKPNVQLLSNVVRTMKTIYGRMSWLAVFLLGTLGTCALLRPISRVPRPFEAWIAWMVVIASILITFWGSYLTAYLQGVDKIAVLRRWESFWTIGGIVITSLIVVMGFGLLPIVLSMQFFSVAAVLWNYRMVSHLQASLIPSNVSSSGRDVFQYIWPAAWRSGLGVMCASVLMYYGPSLIYAQSSDARSVVAFLFSMRFMVAISQLSQAPFYSKIPSMARSFAAGEREQVVALSERGMRLSYSVFLAGVLLSVAFGLMLKRIAPDEAEFVPPFFWSLLAIGFFLERWGAMNIQLYSLSNHIVWHIANGVTGLIYLGLCAILWPSLQALAFPLSMVVACGVFYTPYSIRLSHRLFQLKSFQHEWKTFAVPVATLLIAFSLIAYQWLPR